VISHHWPFNPGTGWSDPSITHTQEAKWDEFRKLCEGMGPLGINHEAVPLSTDDYYAHNVVMTFGYALSLVARNRAAVSILDWGSGLGHYARLAHALLPDVPIEYYAHDLAPLIEAGQRLQPDVNFFPDDVEWRRRRYDLVLVSGSLQCVADWHDALAGISSVTAQYALITRVGVVQTAPTFVHLETPSQLEYQSQLASWVFNRQELLTAAERAGLTLVREFVLHPLDDMPGAPETADLRGYLFRPRSRQGPQSRTLAQRRGANTTMASARVVARPSSWRSSGYRVREPRAL